MYKCSSQSHLNIRFTNRFYLIRTVPIMVIKRVIHIEKDTLIDVRRFVATPPDRFHGNQR